MRRLEAFAASEDPKLRAIAASHPRLPANLLLKLLTDSVPSVRRAAVKNTSIPSSMLVIAEKDSDLGIAAYAKLLSGGNDE